MDFGFTRVPGLGLVIYYMDCLFQIVLNATYESCCFAFSVCHTTHSYKSFINPFCKT